MLPVNVPPLSAVGVVDTVAVSNTCVCPLKTHVEAYGAIVQFPDPSGLATTAVDVAGGTYGFTTRL
jgi:hypothetical protein